MQADLFYLSGSNRSKVALQHGTGVDASRNVVTRNIWGAVQVPDGSLFEATPLLDLFLVAALTVDLWRPRELVSSHVLVGWPILVHPGFAMNTCTTVVLWP
jgi:hypothetical protein